MKNSVLIILLIWIALAVVDIVGLFTHIYFIFRVLFGIINGIAMLGCGLMLIDEIKTRRLIKKFNKIKENEL